MSSTIEPTIEQRAFGYYLTAEGHIQAYWKLASGDSNRTLAAKDMELPSEKLWMLCHALELVMKGWIVYKEGTPKYLSRAGKKALADAGKPVPTTLKDYGHNLYMLAKDVVQYYPDLQSYLDNTVLVLDEDGSQVLDATKTPVKQSLLEHLNISYDGDRDYEYPEGKELLSHIRPIDKFADFISTFRHRLLTEIMAHNGGVIPTKYHRSYDSVSAP